MIGSSELLLILAVAFLLLGPKRLPEVAKSLGKATAEYRKAARDFELEAIKAEKEVLDGPKDGDRKSP
ncbi:MAG: twin-arginine translocase TatA/TatE family subunit [Candidatus Aenigmarchaeota archaeon]|nr:twin-arginine translocase TatA/TatE family subunit [Candidatus Aenigmarchaeota archaeon]